MICYKDNPKAFKEALNIFVDKLEEFNLDYFVFGGALLGWIRSGDFIPYDFDIDFAVKVKKELELIPFINWVKRSARVIKFGKDHVQCFYNDVKVDVVAQSKWGGKYIYNIYNARHGYVFTAGIPAKFLDSLETFEFEGRRYNVPARTEEYLQWRFGTEWREPGSDEHKHRIYGRDLGSASLRARQIVQARKDALRQTDSGS